MKQYYDFKIEKIENLSSEEINSRKKNLELFYKIGFPNKKDEDWKFSDLNSIINNNFNKIVNNDFLPGETEFKTIEEFEHNYISLLNGKLISKLYKLIISLWALDLYLDDFFPIEFKFFRLIPKLFLKPKLEI